MDQRSVCWFLEIKGLSTRAIHNELIAVLSYEAVDYSTIMKYLRQRKNRSDSIGHPFIESEMEENFIDKVISIVLKNEPFSSI
jgi:hypothetical protein